MPSMPNDPASPPPERPRSEPEIIPPGQSGRRGGGERTIWVSFDDQGGTQRIYVAQPGPFAIIAALVIAALVLAGIVLLLFGLVLVWIPVVVLVVAALLTTGYIRYYWRRLRQWTASR
jgi:fatty acid desaturase